jgi:hypothetical protein
MKRRLSVAISFMGNPLVVYLDEPSTVRGGPGIPCLMALLRVRGSRGTGARIKIVSP